VDGRIRTRDVWTVLRTATKPEVTGDDDHGRQPAEHHGVLVWIDDILDVVVDEAALVARGAGLAPQSLLEPGQRALHADQHARDSPRQRR
jgi:hypothetical protein